MNKTTENKGITLIALVITIIVLLILAGITLTFVLGENGLFGKARNAKEEHNKSTASETLTLKITECQIKSYAEEGQLPNLQYIADRFCEDNDIAYVHLQKKSTSAINDKIELGSNTSIYTKLEKYPYEFEINSSLQLASIDGVQIASNNDTSGDYVSRAQYESLLARVVALENAGGTQNSTKLELDYDNGIDLKNTLNTEGNTYTVPENGYVYVCMGSTANELSIFDLEVKKGDTMVDDMDLRTKAEYSVDLTDHTIVNKGTTLRLHKARNLSDYIIKFYPFK